jgi:predicted phage terminase large subunit-like protein
MPTMYAPASPKQEMFLNSDATITIAGGSAGSGKSFTALLIALKFMQHPRATGVIFRRNSVMLRAPGSIWQEAVAMYSDIYPTGLRVKHRELEIIFPNGAVLKFSHMQHEANMYDHKGAQYSLVIFDEATDFTQIMINYLMSRMRNAYVPHKPQMFLMTNPDYSSFIREWLQDYYLDHTGVPIAEKAGHKRYFVQQNGKVIWYDTLAEAQAIHGTGNGTGITSFSFIGANCHDNPPLLKAQPDYVSNLLALPEIEKQRLYYGNWFVRPSASGLYKRAWVNRASIPNPLPCKRVRAYDVAGSLPSSAYPNPDWTRGVLVSKDKSSKYTVEDLVSIRDRFYEVEELIINTARNDGTSVTVVLPCDPNAQAGAWARGMQRKLGEMGFNCRLVKPQKSKAERFAPFSTIAQAGFVEIVEADWNKEFEDELEVFDANNTKQHDDIVDACSDCIYVLNQGNVLPDLSPASFVANFSSNTSGHSEMFSQLNPNSPVHQSVLPSYSFPSFLK